jgi:hypothetical protein
MIVVINQSNFKAQNVLARETESRGKAVRPSLPQGGLIEIFEQKTDSGVQMLL